MALICRPLRGLGVQLGRDPGVTVAPLAHPGLNSAAATRLVDAPNPHRFVARCFNHHWVYDPVATTTHAGCPRGDPGSLSVLTLTAMSSSSKKPAPLWRCPECGRSFANRNQTHSCSNVTLESHFTGKSEKVRELFDELVALIKKSGPVKVLPEKTRIAFQVRMSFIAVQVRRFGQYHPERV